MRKYFKELEAWKEILARIEQEPSRGCRGICVLIWALESKYQITHRMAVRMCKRLDYLPRQKDSAYVWRFGARKPRWIWVNRFIRRYGVDVKKQRKK